MHHCNFPGISFLNTTSSENSESDDVLSMTLFAHDDRLIFLIISTAKFEGKTRISNSEEQSSGVRVRNRHKSEIGSGYLHTTTERLRLILWLISVKQCQKAGQLAKPNAAFESRMSDFMGPWKMCLYSDICRTKVQSVQPRYCQKPLWFTWCSLRVPSYVDAFDHFRWNIYRSNLCVDFTADSFIFRINPTSHLFTSIFRYLLLPRPTTEILFNLIQKTPPSSTTLFKETYLSDDLRYCTCRLKWKIQCYSGPSKLLSRMGWCKGYLHALFQFPMVFASTEQQSVCLKFHTLCRRFRSLKTGTFQYFSIFLLQWYK